MRLTLTRGQIPLARETVAWLMAFSATMRTPVVAWHWITAEVPMPETEHGDVAGEVEQPCAGMPSDQKGSE